MSIEPGLLVQPFVSVIWGDLNLTAYQGMSGELERIAQNVSLSYNKDQYAPSCDFEFAPTFDGFEVAGVIRSSPDLLKEPVTIEMGYPHLPEPRLKSQFLFTGIDYTTGLDPKLKFTLVSAIKSSWTENKISVTMEDEIPLSEYPEFLKEKAGKGASLLKFKFVGQAEIDAPDIMVKRNSMNQTPQVTLTEQLKEHGMELRTGDTAIDGTIVIGYYAGNEKELEKDKPRLGGVPEAGVRQIHILGPGLLENATRKQKFTLGQSDKKGGAKNKATAATETENKNSSNPKPLAEKAATESEISAGNLGTSDKSQARSGTTKDKPSEKEKARLAIADELKMELTASFPMLPQVVGMKPGDILAIPSLKGPGEWIEDYEVVDVQYTQKDTGEVNMSIKCTKPWLGTDNMMDASSVQLVKSKVQGLKTPEAWAQFYWQQGPDSAPPLSS